MTETRSSTSLRLGYRLVRPDQTLPWLPDHPYRGVDREPRAPSPANLADRQVAAWQFFEDARDSGALAAERAVARQVQDRLAKALHRLEIVYARAVVLPGVRIAGQPADEAAERELRFRRVRNRGATVEPLPSGFVRLGLDVTLLPEAHSVIVQPGLVDHDDKLARRLNDDGLVVDDGVARDLMEAANGTGYGLALFAVVEVWAES